MIILIFVYYLYVEVIKVFCGFLFINNYIEDREYLVL